MTSRRKTWLVWIPPLLWAAALFALSAVPGRSLPASSLPNSDKLVHAVVYGVLGALCYRAVRGSTTLSPGRSLLLAALIATGYGATDELHQTQVPQRSADARDLLADAAGATAGALTARLWGARRREEGAP